MNLTRFTGKDADLLIEKKFEKLRMELPKIGQLVKFAAKGHMYYDIFDYSINTQAAIRIMKEILQKQSKNIEVEQQAFSIRVKWKFEDWISYPNFLEMALKEIYDRCIIHMKTYFEEGDDKIDLSFLFNNTCYNSDILQILQNILREDGFTLTFSNTNQTWNVVVTRP